MTFDQMDIYFDFDFSFGQFTIMKTKESHRCASCYTKTNFIEMGFNEYLCSEICVRARWRKHVGSIYS